MEAKQPDKSESRVRNMAILGIVSGVLAIMMFSDPPMTLCFGAVAIVLAWLSRSYNNRHFSRMAMVAFVLGIVGIILSLFIFFNFMLAMAIMDDPESIAASMDPASAEEFRGMIDYYRNALSGAIQ